MPGVHQSREEARNAEQDLVELAVSESDQRALFSQQAISRAVLKRVLQKPYVLYPTAVGLLGAMSSLLLGPDLWSLGAAVLGLSIGIGAWAVDYHLRREVHAGLYLNGLHRSLADQRESFIQTLERDLEGLKSEEGIRQLQRLREKYLAFEGLLGRKLDPFELTYSRYLGMAEQLYLSALDNLQRAVHIEQGSEAINEGYIRGRMRELKKTRSPSTAQQQEIETLQARLKLKEGQREKIDRWLSQNEQAMTQLDLTMAAIAEMDTVRGQAGMEMEEVMAELQRLAGRARKFEV